MATPFKASLVTPEAIILETSIVSAQVPAVDGLIGILHMRAPLLARLSTGVLRFDTDDHASQQFMVSGGYAQMKDDILTILTTEAIPADKINPELINAEQVKLKAVEGTDLKAMQQRSAIQARIQAMRSLHD